MIKRDETMTNKYISSKSRYEILDTLRSVAAIIVLNDDYRN